jgi:LDH2 family malate/lactate/ureidoglycolate dehydrogenase
MSEGFVRVGSEELKRFTVEVLVGIGVPRDDAEIEAEVLVWANLRGVDSHGVLRIPLYLEWLGKGIMNPHPNVRVEKETSATILIEADLALGPVVTTMAMKRVIAKAKEAGIGWCLIRNTTHQGAMAYYAIMAAEAGMAGIVSVCSPPNMAPYGARVAGVHNSPIAIAVPGKRHRPIVLDMATSVAAGGKVDLAKDKGIPIPSGWALDKDGSPTTDPNLSAMLVPFGGPKGSGLAVMFECLSSLMVGNPLLAPNESNKHRIHRGVQNSFVAAIDIGAFTDVEAYKEDVDSLVDRLKGLPTAKGADEVLVPGELEDRVYLERSANGIPLPPGTVASLRSAADRFDITLPAAIV